MSPPPWRPHRHAAGEVDRLRSLVRRVARVRVALRGERHARSSRNPARFYNFQHPNPKSDGFTGDAAWLEGDWKLLAVDSGAETGAKPRFELYDLATDSGERRDVASKHREVVARMQKGLNTWQRSVERSLSGADYPDREGAKH